MKTKELLLKELSNNKKHDKASLAYCLNSINPHTNCFAVLCSYKRVELMAMLDKALNEQKNIDKLLKFNNLKHLTENKSNDEQLKEAIKNENPITFVSGGVVENDVKIVSINTDDIESKDFVFETKKGDKFTRFSNNIVIVERVKINELRKGDKVFYYDAILEIIEDSRESRYTKDLFVAKCKYVSGNDDLKNYDHFQSNLLINYLKIK